MGVSALRVAAYAGVFVGGFILGSIAAVPASADPGDVGHGHADAESSKSVDNKRPSLNRIVHRLLSEHRKRMTDQSRTAPRVKIGSDRHGGSVPSEQTAATFSEPVGAPSSASAPGDARETRPGGYRGSAADSTAVTPADTPHSAGGSDHSDTAPDTPAASSGEYPFPYYLLEIRRGTRDWWSAERIISRLGRAIDPYRVVLLEPKPEPKPEPEPPPEPAPVAGPAFRGPAPQAPAPEPQPVLDASGGIVAGSDYHATGFGGGARVLSAPIVAMPVPPPAAVRFPAFPFAPAAAPAPRLGSAAGHSGVGEPAQAARTIRQADAPEAAQPRATSNAIPRRGYTDYLRRPGLPQLAGAALPGVAGMALMTLAGGVLGYRQARAGRMIRAGAAARYLP